MLRLTGGADLAVFDAGLKVENFDREEYKMSLLRLWCVRAIIGYSVLWVLFLIPYTGIVLMFAMIMLGPYIWGLIPHFIILALVVDIQTKKLSRVFWIIPVLLYGGYYAFYFSEEIKILSIEHKLKKENPVLVLKYDPEKYSLVSNDSGNIGKYNKIAVVYDENRNFSEGFLSYRVSSRDLCNQAKNLRINNLRLLGVSWSEYKSIHGRNYNFRPTVCQIMSVEVPNKERIRVLKAEENRYSKENRNKLVYETRYSFYLNDEKLATFVAGQVNRLPWFPFVLSGCGLNSAAPSWECFLSFQRKRGGLDFWPSSVDIDQYGRNPVAVMLQIEKYSEEDLRGFSDYPDTVQYIKNLSEKRRRRHLDGAQ